MATAKQVKWVDLALESWGAWEREGGGLGLSLDGCDVVVNLEVVPLTDDEGLLVNQAVAKLDVLLRIAVKLKYHQCLTTRQVLKAMPAVVRRESVAFCEAPCARTFERWIARAHDQLVQPLHGLRVMFDHEGPMTTKRLREVRSQASMA